MEVVLGRGRAGKEEKEVQLSPSHLLLGEESHLRWRSDLFQIWTDQYLRLNSKFGMLLSFSESWIECYVRSFFFLSPFLSTVLPTYISYTPATQYLTYQVSLWFICSSQTRECNLEVTIFVTVPGANFHHNKETHCQENTGRIEC